MLVDAIRLNAFRGVRNELEIDMTVPITVLYAVNGTGKTTICDAMEWLLLGDVERLATAKNAVVNWFRDVDDNTRLVEADIQISDDLVSIGRTTSRLKALSGSRWTNLPDAELHRRLIGHEIPAGSTTERNRAQREWIRAARFFDGQALDHYVDSTPDGRVLRRRAFSSLFGVGLRQQQRTHLARLLQDMTPTWQDAGVSAAKEALEVRRRALLLESSANLAALERELRNRLERAEAQVELGIVDGTITTGRGEVVRIRLEERKASLSLASQSVSILRERRDQILTRQQYLASVRISLDELTSHLVSLANKKRELDIVYAEAVHGEQKAASLRDGVLGVTRRLATLRGRLAATLQDWRWPVDVWVPSEDETTARIAAATAVANAAYKNRAAWAHCVEQCPDWVGARRAGEIAAVELANARARVQALRPSSVIDQDIEEQKRQITEAKAALDRIGGFVSRLHQEGAAVIAELGDDPCCPLCGHAHDSADALRNAVNSRLAQEPSSVSRLAGALQRAADRLRELNAEMDTLTSANSVVRAAAARAADISERLDAAAETLVALGLTKDIIERTDLPEFVRQAAEEAIRAEESANKAHAEAQQVAKVAAALRSIATELAAETSALGSPLTAEFLQIALSDWESNIAVALERAERMSLDANQAVQSALGTVALASQQSQDAVMRLQETTRRRDDLLFEIDTLNAWIAEWDAARSRLDLQDLPSEQQLDEIASSIQQRLTSYEELAAGMPGLIEEIDSYGRRLRGHEELKGLEKRLGDARRLSAIRMKWASDIGTAIRILDDRQRLDIEAQLGPLRGTIRAIFGRSQVLEVIDQIDVLTLDDGGLDWKVAIGDHDECEMRVLSRGQRQDLALSLFLARAVSIGGTVFMDEPLLHLDDLNRVGLLDTLRVIAQEAGHRVRVVITTADRMLVRHLNEKFSLLVRGNRQPLMQVVELSGGPREGVKADLKPVVRKPMFDALSLLPSLD